MNPIIVTGATGSMGAVACRVLASEGTPVIMACRNLEKGERLRQDILKDFPDASLELVKLDLESMEGVRSFVDALAGRPLAGIFNNAGTMCRNYGVTADGFERTMAVNYLLPAFLNRLLVPQFEEGAHIVDMVSVTTKISHVGLDWTEKGEKDFSQLGTYGKSKLAFLYFSIALARRCPQLHVNVSDPGVVNSKMITMDRWFDPLADVLFRPFISSPETGVKPALAALKCDDSLHYFVGKRSGMIPSRFLKSQLVDQLWDQATQLLGL